MIEQTHHLNDHYFIFNPVADVSRLLANEEVIRWFGRGTGTFDRAGQLQVMEDSKSWTLLYV